MAGLAGQRYGFAEMCGFISGFFSSNTQVPFKQEIILCIMWEESQYINQKNSAGALGFGQLTSLKEINKEYGKAFTGSSILQDPFTSAEAACYYLWLMFKWGKTQKGALSMYAGATYPNVPKRWTEAETLLKAAKLSYPDGTISGLFWNDTQRKQIVAALTKCNNGAVATDIPDLSADYMSSS